MSNIVLIKRLNNLLQLSLEGDQPLPEWLVARLHADLSYQKKEFIRQIKSYNLGDDEVPFINKGAGNMTFTTFTLYQLVNGALVTGSGFLSKIVRQLQQWGISSRFVDISPPRRRPDCYTPDWDNLYAKLPGVRPKQIECLQRIVDNDCGIIAAATGFGKSYLVEALCHLYPHAKIHFVVPQKDVAFKVADTLTAKLPGIGMFGGGAKAFGERITIFTAGSIHHSDGDADILLCDEVHEMMTDRLTTQIATIWQSARNFGFTATPSGRMDGADAQLELFFGPQIFYLPYQEAVELGLVVPMRVRWLNIDLPNNPCVGYTDVAKMRAGIWRNQARNEIIARDVRQHYANPNTQVLILCATVDHAIHLWHFLPEFSLCFSDQDAKDIAWYKKVNLLPPHFEEVTPKIRERMRKEFSAGTLKRVIATDVWTTGVDFASLQVMYRVDARASKIKDAQAPGRVSRIHPASGKRFGEVIDCMDRFDSGFKSKSESRKRNYKALGWEQITQSDPRQLLMWADDYGEIAGGENRG